MNSGRRFEWDDAKAQSNLAKHGVPFTYAARVFLDPDVVDFDASKPEDGEVRRKAVGVIGGRLFAVVYTERDDVIRIISARRCNAAEARRYGPVHS
ncbi:BrnT family toxin [Phenylobacterium sp.]|uniref:BrnT family toxin n=1 Tax=Phenylobacterium sp. TaxID=1871053 RepID=UPI002FCB08A9